MQELEANRRCQRQTNQHHGLVPPPPPPHMQQISPVTRRWFAWSSGARCLVVGRPGGGGGGYLQLLETSESVATPTTIAMWWVGLYAAQSRPCVTRPRTTLGALRMRCIVRQGSPECGVIMLVIR